MIPGKPDESLIIQALRYADGHGNAAEDNGCPEPVVNDFVTWVQDGRAGSPAENAPKTAKKARHDGQGGAVVLPAGDESATPAVKAKAVAARCDGCLRPGETWSRRAFRRLRMRAPGVLIRRLYFDLIGLPPSAEEVQAFVADLA